MLLVLSFFVLAFFFVLANIGAADREDAGDDAGERDAKEGEGEDEDENAGGEEEHVGAECLARACFRLYLYLLGEI